MAQILALVDSVEEKAVKILNEANVEKKHLKEESDQRLKEYELKRQSETNEEIKAYQLQMDREVLEKEKQLEAQYEEQMTALKDNYQKQKQIYLHKLVAQVIGE